MVRGDIQQDGDIGTEIVHIIQLETAELDDIILMWILCYLKSEGVANVACQSSIVTSLLEDMVDERSGSGLTIRARDTYHLRIRIATSKLDLTDDMDALLLDLHNHRSRIGDARTLDDLIGIEYLGLCVLTLFPFDLTVVEHLLVLVGNLRHV